MKSAKIDHRNRATKSRRLTAIARSEELLLLKMAQFVKAFGDEVALSGATDVIFTEFVSSLAKYRQGTLVFDDINVDEEAEDA